MKVQDLIDILSEQDPDAEVLLMTQQSWPFEYSIAGVTCRSELVGDDGEDSSESDDGTKPEDVFLVEGRQLRYGNANAWNVAHR
jgi:hypothetical protein